MVWSTASWSSCNKTNKHVANWISLTNSELSSFAIHILKHSANPWYFICRYPSLYPYILFDIKQWASSKSHVSPPHPSGPYHILRRAQYWEGLVLSSLLHCFTQFYSVLHCVPVTSWRRHIIEKFLYPPPRLTSAPGDRRVNSNHMVLVSSLEQCHTIYCTVGTVA